MWLLLSQPQWSEAKQLQCSVLLKKDNQLCVDLILKTFQLPANLFQLEKVEALLATIFYQGLILFATLVSIQSSRRVVGLLCGTDKKKIQCPSNEKPCHSG